MSDSIAKTPRLDALLRRLKGTLVRNVWLYGLGTLVAAAATWLLFMYVADRVLKLPTPIRLIHLGVLVAGSVAILQRTLVRHRRRIPDRTGLAMLAQGTLPEDVPRDDRFVSALQLTKTTDPAASNASLVRRVAAQAEEVVPRTDIARVTDPRKPRKRVALGTAALAVTAASLAQNPAMARIFGQRMIGRSVSWPRATNLNVDVPADTADLEVVRDGDVIRVRAARGSDIPIFVKADGIVPDIVTLSFESGAVIDIGPSGPDSFRTVLPSIQERSVIRVTGGDDDRGVPSIEIEVLQPPDLTAIAFNIQPPAYSGLPERLEENTNVSVLAGSLVTVHVATDPGDATGIARSFPADEEIALISGAYPLALTAGPRMDPGAESSDPAVEVTAPVPGLKFERTALESLRFRFELVDSSGLRNPDPALFGIEVVPDRAPELVLLDPGRADIETIQGGAVPLRVLCRDDFGVGSIRLSLSDLSTEEVLQTLDLTLTDATLPAGETVRGPRATKLGSQLIEIDSISPDGPMAEGSVVVMELTGTDLREPVPNESASAPVRIRVVGADEFLRRQRDALGRAAEDVTRIGTQVDKTTITIDSFALALSGDEAEAPSGSNIQGVINEARRSQGDLRSITRDLSSIASSMVYARLDDRSTALEARLFELTGASPERSFLEESWTTLAAELGAGRLGQPERAGDLVRVVGLGLDACGPRSTAWIVALEALREAKTVDESRERLADATAALAALQTSIESLGLQLGEWDSLQSIQALARDILNGQKNLVERTRKAAESGR